MTEAFPVPTLPKVLIYRSAITDIRTVEARLRRAELPFEVEVIGMASPEERKRYRELKQSSGHGTLPLIFIDERCIGGEPELARYIADRRDRAPETPDEPPSTDADSAQETAQTVPAPEASAPAPDHPPADSDEPVTTPLPASRLDAPLEPAPEASSAPAADASAGALRRRTGLLGYAGLIPFFACTAGSFFGPQQELARLALVAYGAVIFSFVGAVHWGYSLGQAPSAPRGLVASVVPSLVGWAALMLHAQTGATASLALLGVSFLVWHLFERASARLPRHYLRLRLHLTALVCSLLAGSAIAVTLGLGHS